MLEYLRLRGPERLLQEFLDRIHLRLTGSDWSFEVEIYDHGRVSDQNRNPMGRMNLPGVPYSGCNMYNPLKKSELYQLSVVETKREYQM